MRKTSLFKWSAVVAGIALFIAACNNRSQGDKNNGDTTKTDTLKAQAPPPPPPVPQMWVPYQISVLHEQNYRAIVGTTLNRGETDSVYFTYAEFFGMLDYFTNNLSGIKYMDAFFADSPNGKLTILFSPFDGSYTKKGYFSLPEGGTKFDPSVSLVPDNTGDGWITNYKNNQLKQFTPMVDAGDGSNYPGGVVGSPNQKSNTLHVWYYLVNLVELKGECYYQQNTLHNKCDGIKMFFSKYPSPGILRNRIYLQYELCRDDIAGNHNVWYIDTTTGFINRPNLKANYNWIDKVKGVDNGQMCPPTCTP